MLVRSGAVDVVVVDSVAALVPKAEIEGEMGDTPRRPQARLMSQALRKLTGDINKTNTIVIFINQLRKKIGVMFGSPETTRRQRAEVLRVRPARHPAHRAAQGGRRGDRQPHPRQGREEQGRAAVPAGGVRHHLRLGHHLRGELIDVGVEPKRGPEVGRLGSASTTSGSVRAWQNAAAFLA